MSADPDVPLASEALLRPVRPGNAVRGHRRTAAADHPARRAAAGRVAAARTGTRGAARVSRDTVREAIKSLADAGYLVSRRGRYGGTFLADELPSAHRTTLRV